MRGYKIKKVRPNLCGAPCIWFKMTSSFFASPANHIKLLNFNTGRGRLEFKLLYVRLGTPEA